MTLTLDCGKGNSSQNLVSLLAPWNQSGLTNSPEPAHLYRLAYDMLNTHRIKMDVLSFCDLHGKLHYLLLCFRCDNLECIYNQLNARKVRNMAELLDRVQSSYFPSFKAMFRDVAAGKERALLYHRCMSCWFHCWSFVHLLVFVAQSHYIWLHWLLDVLKAFERPQSLEQRRLQGGVCWGRHHREERASRSNKNRVMILMMLCPYDLEYEIRVL